MESSEKKKKSSYTLVLSDIEAKRLKQWCQRELWIEQTVPYSSYAYSGREVRVILYKKGKLLIQGKGTEDFIRFVLEPKITGVPQLDYDTVLHPEWFKTHAGLDESGKGDLFGPLVCACVIADGPVVQKWLDKGIRDSKKIIDQKTVFSYEKLIRESENTVCELAFARLEKYNQLYTSFGSNLNLLLAWLHSKALKSALEKRKVPWGLLDQFSKKPLVQTYFSKEEIDLRMRPRAEEDPIVAAASILARAEYLRQMEKLSRLVRCQLQRGAGAKALEQARFLVQQKGKDMLIKVAKTHFKPISELLT